MAMSSVPTAPTTRSFMKCTRTPTNFPCSTANSATGKMSTTACGLTRPSPTSLRSNSSANTNENKERQSVTNLLDEYRDLQAHHRPLHNLELSHRGMAAVL